MSGQEYKVAWLCEALLVSRSGYYDWVERRRRPRPREVENIRLRARIREEFGRSRETYGSPRLAHALGCPGRRNRIARLMRQERLFARQRSKYRRARPTALMADPSRLIVSNNSLSAVPITSGSLTLLASSPAKDGFTSLLSWTAALGASSAGPCTRSSTPVSSSPLCAWRCCSADPHGLLSFTPIAAPSLPVPLTGSSLLGTAWLLP